MAIPMGRLCELAASSDSETVVEVSASPSDGGLVGVFGASPRGKNIT